MISVMPVPRNMNFTVLSSGILVPLFSFPLQILIRRMLLDFCKPMCYIECMAATKSAKIFSIFIEYKRVKPNETQKTLRIGTRRSALALCACRLHLRQNHRRGGTQAAPPPSPPLPPKPPPKAALHPPNSNLRPPLGKPCLPPSPIISPIRT